MQVTCLFRGVHQDFLVHGSQAESSDNRSYYNGSRFFFFPILIDAELLTPVEGRRHTVSSSPALDLGLRLIARSDLDTHGSVRLPARVDTQSCDGSLNQKMSKSMDYTFI